MYRTSRSGVDGGDGSTTSFRVLRVYTITVTSVIVTWLGDNCVWRDLHLGERRGGGMGWADKEHVVLLLK